MNKKIIKDNYEVEFPENCEYTEEQMNKVVEDCIKTNDEVMDYIKEHPDYSICGNAAYLGYENKDCNICEQMISLLPYLKKCENDLSLKPVYLKD